MVQTCCIKNCKERQNRNTNISFHKFPKNPQLREKWIKAINCENFEPSAHSRVCSKHFRSDCFVGTSLGSKRNLKYGTIPSVSEVHGTPHVQETNIVNITYIKVENESASLNDEFANEGDSFKPTASSYKNNALLHMKPLKKKRTAYVGDFLKSDMITDQEKYVHIIERTLTNKNKQIKILQQSNRRLHKKVKHLYALLDELKNKSMINEHVCEMPSEP